MPNWPASLPQKQFSGLQVKPRDSVARNEMDAGPPTRRNRFTAVSKEVTVPITLNGSQKKDFDEFFENTLKNGALSFTWEDPVSDVNTQFAFREPPQWTLEAGGSTDSRKWKAELKLEMLP